MLALITGAQQGIGAAMAVALAAAGHDIALNWLDDEAAARDVAARIEAHGRRATLVQGDVARSAAAIVAGCQAPPDICICNAGIFPRVAFLDMTEAEWDAVHDVNLKGAAFTAQAAARGMVAAGKPGVILTVASQAMRGTPVGAHYSATKSGLLGLTRSIALALAPHNIRANAIAPGLTDTAQPRYGNTDDEVRAMGAALPLGRLGTPEDIAAMAVFLCSPQAAWITGQVFHVNGGGYMP